jgi:hypothetical protein
VYSLGREAVFEQRLDQHVLVVEEQHDCGREVVEGRKRKMLFVVEVGCLSRWLVLSQKVKWSGTLRARMLPRAASIFKSLGQKVPLEDKTKTNCRASFQQSS